MNYHDITHEDMTPIPNFEEYLISKDGDIYSTKSHKFLKSWLDSKGYLQIQLFKSGIKHCFKVHRLVAEVFIPNPYNLPEVNHKDENKQTQSLPILSGAQQHIIVIMELEEKEFQNQTEIVLIGVENPLFNLIPILILLGNTTLLKKLKTLVLINPML